MKVYYDADADLNLITGIGVPSYGAAAAQHFVVWVGCNH